MTSSATDWHAVALGKLCKILGDKQGKAVMAQTLSAAGLANLSSATELRLFAELLKPRGGILGATGALLSLHAVIHSRG